MNAHSTLSDELRDRAAAYVSGSLSGIERTAFEGHLDGCKVCLGEVTAVRGLAQELETLVPEVVPPERVWVRVRDRVGKAPQHDVAEDPNSFKEVLDSWASQQSQDADLTYVAASDHPWLSIRAEGIDVRPLHVDRSAGRVTCVVRMAPGASYPPHHHAGVEECYVLEGDLRVGDDLHMQAGDYQRAEAGSKHVEQRTERGCLLLITSSLADTPAA